MSAKTPNVVWPPRSSLLSRTQLVDLKDAVNSLDFTATADAVAASMSRFLVVRACGHIEYTLIELIVAYSERMSHHSSISSYVRGTFSGAGRNPRPGLISETLRRLRPEWATKFDVFVDNDDEYFKRELNFLVDRRNKIAHGESEGIGRRKALTLADVSIEITDFLTKTLNPETL